MISKLLWNPDCNIEAVKKDFLEGYYGPAAGCINEYIKLFTDKVNNEGIHFGISSAPTAAYLDEGVLVKADEIINKAEKLVEGTKKYEWRLRRIRATLVYPRIAHKILANEAASEEINDFFNEVTSLGYNRLEEGMPLEKRRRYALEMGRLCGLVNGKFSEE